MAAIDRVDPVDEATAVFEMTGPFSPLLRVLGDRAGMLLAPSAFDRINTPNSREAPVGTGAFTYVDEDIDGPYVQQVLPGILAGGRPAGREAHHVPGSRGDTAGERSADRGVRLPGGPCRRRISGELKTRAIRSASRARTRWDSSTSTPTSSRGVTIHLRLAFNHAIDRDKYVEVVYENLHLANHWGYLGPALAGIHDPDEILIRYDPDRVREELALAGMPDGFAFDMNTSRGMASRPQNLSRPAWPSSESR